MDFVSLRHSNFFESTIQEMGIIDPNHHIGLIRFHFRKYIGINTTTNELDEAPRAKFRDISLVCQSLITLRTAPLRSPYRIVTIVTKSGWLVDVGEHELIRVIALEGLTEIYGYCSSIFLRNSNFFHYFLVVHEEGMKSQNKFSLFKCRDLQYLLQFFEVLRWSPAFGILRSLSAPSEPWPLLNKDLESQSSETGNVGPNIQTPLQRFRSVPQKPSGLVLVLFNLIWYVGKST
jgi:hypothetical protein